MDTVHTLERPPFTVSTDRDRLDIEVIHGFLRESYWAKGIPREVVERCIENSLCFGVYRDGAQLGFARVTTDYATLAYLADVFVLPAARGQGLSKLLMDCIMSHPQLQGLRRWMLATFDAHGLYRQYGFKQLEKPERLMEIVDMDIYSRREGR